MYHYHQCAMTSIIRQFQQYLYEVGYGTSTQNMLPALVQEFMKQEAVIDVRYIEQQTVKNFYDYLQTRPLKWRSGALSDRMIHHYVYALKTFFSWLEVTEQLDYNPISGMKFRRPVLYSREPLTTGEINALFKSTVSLKETAVLHLFYSCGLRRSEGERLNIHDLHFKEQLLYVRAGKGAKRRVVPMTIKVVADLEQYYLQERCSSAIKKVKDEAAFMLNRIGHRMSGDSCNHLLKDLVNRSGLNKETTLHHLRHSIATHLLQGGMSMEYVCEFLGHRFLESTQLYAKPLSTQLKLL